MPRKILIFAYAYYPYVGGAEVAVKEITDRTDSFVFDMITRRFNNGDPAFEQVGNIAVHRVTTLTKYLFPLVAAQKANKLIKENSYALLWSIMANYAGFAALFVKLRNPAMPFLLTLQEGDPLSSIKRKVIFVYPLFKQIFTKADVISAISSYLGNFAKEMGYSGTPSIVPNGVDLDIFLREKPPIWPKGKMRKEVTLITVSRLVEKNAVGDIIKSLKFLPPNVKLLVVGDGCQRNNLQKMAKQYNLPDRVRFVGTRDHKQVAKYLGGADIFVRPSLSEGLGNSYLEAMAQGIPVIATAVGGIPDFLSDRKTGFFCEVGNPKSIAGKVQYIIDEKHSTMVNNVIWQAQKLIRQRYNWNTISSTMQEIFERLT